jgi:hypothetical protein
MLQNHRWCKMYRTFPDDEMVQLETRRKLNDRVSNKTYCTQESSLLHVLTEYLCVIDQG